MTSYLEHREETRPDIDLGMLGRVKMGYDSDVFRRYHVDSVGKPKNDTNLYLYTGNNPVNRTDPSGESWITPLIVVTYSVGAVYIFKDCMERCTHTKLPRDPNTCPPPDNMTIGTCAKLCINYAVLLGFGADPVGSLSTTVGGAVGNQIKTGE